MSSQETSRETSQDPIRGTIDAGKSVFVSASDGLRLHVREYGARGATGLAVVCLPGLTRTVADFDILAAHLTRAGARRIIALDSRGRGQSEYDRNPENYNLLVELGDLVSVLTALAVGPAIFVGSSRGGLLTMQLGVAHPTAIAGVVLHDIGPVIEPKGLARLRSYVGKIPQPRNFDEGAAILRQLFYGQFPNLSAEQWLAAAQRAWQQRGNALTPTYDVNLSQTLTNFDIERPLPPLWNEFDALKRVPLLIIHGAKSDILSGATVASMAERHPGAEIIEVADQGHVPLLEGDELLRRIEDFVAKCDAAKCDALRNFPKAVEAKF
jgi:pimeloyl-ACP methyl ester carboxylesterase